MEEVPILKVEYLLTRKCSLSCDYCLIRDSSSLHGKEMEFDLIVEMLKIVANNWPGAPVVLFGGEPTERDDLPNIIRVADAMKIKTVVISNSRRVLRDKNYRERLIDAGLENWSTSFDSLEAAQVVDRSCLVKSEFGFTALKMFRDDYGLRDLVTCVTVTRHNIDYLPEIVTMLTAEGIWSIFTPLQVGGQGYEYSQGSVSSLPRIDQIERIAPWMKRLALSGHYLMHNDPDWFDTWPEQFLDQTWRCNDKALLTVDADGYLRYCVDIPFREEDRMHVLELASKMGRNRFARVIAKGPPCTGCLWDPAYEAIKRARSPDVGVEEGRRRYRHEIPEDRRRKLILPAQKWFKGNPYLRPVRR